MNVIRRADRSDLNEIHRMQDIPFRDRVFIEQLPPRKEFVEKAEQNIMNGLEHYYVQESEGSVAGFIHLLKKADWEALTWGKWLNTLLYACCVVSFDRLQLPKLIFALRDGNRRVQHLYEKYGFRNVGSGTHMLSGQSSITNVTHYEITAEEFQQKAHMMQKNSLPLRFI